MKAVTAGFRKYRCHNCVTLLLSTTARHSSLRSPPTSVWTESPSRAGRGATLDCTEIIRIDDKVFNGRLQLFDHSSYRCCWGKMIL